MKKTISSHRICAPLIEALASMRRWLERDHDARMMVAAPTLREFKRQPLPEHLKVSVKKRRGPRVAMHGMRNYRNKSLLIAHWPEDAQETIAAPSLICVVKGHADFHLGDYFFSGQAGDILLIPADVPQPSSQKSHIFDGDPSRSCTLFWMCPKMSYGDGMECWLCHSRGEVHEVCRVDEVCWVKNPFIIQLFRGFCEELRRQQDRPTALHLISGLFALVQREIEEERVFLPGHYGGFAEADPGTDPIAQAKSYIDSHLHQQLSIEKLARHVCVSPATFTRKFRQETGQSFHQYVIKHRLEEAASLLLETDWSVNKICEFVGLKYSPLRRLFMQYHGCSPGVFRELKKTQGKSGKE